MSWQRVEGSTVGADLLEGPEARVADPYWLLGKQWQVGEFTGEDAASPILLEASFAHAPITRFRSGPPTAGAPVAIRDGAGLPLETAAEREPVRTGPAALRVAAEAGLQLWRVLDAAGAPARLRAGIRRAFPLTLRADDGLDPVGRAQLKLLARRSCDARAVHADLTSGRRKLSHLPGAGQAEVVAALAQWATWHAGQFSEPESGVASWDPQRMEYRFQIAAGAGPAAELQLDAAEYTGGHLDWYGFDVAHDVPDMGARGALSTHDIRVVPVPARFAGQAASRWWQVEDGSIWFGDIAAAPEDLARVAVASYATLFGDDWFLAPCRLEAGIIARATSVTMIDTFGDTTSIAACAALDGPDRVWRFFELTGDDSPKCPWLLIPPALPGVTESKPIEEIVFQRDESANLAWAAELRIESAAGRTVDRAAQSTAALTPTPIAAPGAWLYRLATTVPEHNIPLVPVRTLDGTLYLQRGRLAVSTEADGTTTRGALGQILQPRSALLLHDEEVPTNGLRLTRTWQMARTAQGGYVLWVGRRKSPPHPRRSPALLFDQITQNP